MRQLPVNHKLEYLNCKQEQMPRQAHEAVRAIYLLAKMGVEAVTIPPHVMGWFQP